MTERGFGSFAQFTASLALIIYGTTRTPFARAPLPARVMGVRHVKHS